MTSVNVGEDGRPRPDSSKRPLGRRRRRLRRTVQILVALSIGGACVGAIVYWVSRPAQYRPGEDLPEITRTLARNLPEGAPAPRLVDVTAEAGLEGFRCFAGARSSQLPEDMGPGAAWGDFDNDGDPDLFLASNGGSIEADPATWAPCALYENRGDGTFERVDAFEELRLLGMGAAWGDADGDGWLDLVVAGYDRLILLRNDRGRLARDETFPTPPGFWTGVAWGDVDNDRDLDLYVCGYVQYVRSDADRARASRQFGTVVPYTLNPSSYEPERNLLLRNDGTGTFEEVAEELGVANEGGRSLGALWHDFDEDGWLDLYVANDVSDNAFYHNRAGQLVDVSHPAWVADYRGAMGLAVADYDRDGDEDIFITHWVAQENALYDSLLVEMRKMELDATDAPAAPLRFVDSASAKGLGQIAVQRIGWGAEFADFDGDGWPDLVVANGSTFETEGEVKKLVPQNSFLFWNREGAYFHDLSGACAAFSTPRVSRGLALADYDLDGDQDVLFVHRDGGVQLLRNDMQTGNWITLRLRSQGQDGRPTGFGDGATIVASVGDAVLRRAVVSASYLSQSSRTIHLGLGGASSVDQLEVRWVGGEREVFRDLAANSAWEVTEGDPVPRLVRSADRDAAPDPRASKTDRERVVEFWSKHRAAMRAVKVDDDPAAAVPLFREALALDPNHLDARYYLGNCLAVLGDTDAAIAEFERLL
ncbi:MAG: FG-GAP-like repeat-containing protein, partial [Planctomycetota bacterium]